MMARLHCTVALAWTFQRASTARKFEQGFRAACCEPAKRSAHASADAPCKGNTARVICVSPTQVEKLQPPTQDLPSAAQRRQFTNCDALALYDDAEKLSDYQMARAYAFTQLNQSKQDTNIDEYAAAALAMLYANGEGVKQSFELAKKYICEAGGQRKYLIIC